MESAWVSTDALRAGFASAMSDMYQQEVPQYGSLLKLVAQVNRQVLAQDPPLHQQLARNNELERLSVERHGAIRVGTAAELAMLRRLFAVMGMFPVGYYDLSQAGVPVHSTAFRPVDDEALRANPFRLFTSLLRLELIENAALRQQAEEILAARDIFTPRCRELVALSEQQGGLDASQAALFIQEALETFRWHQQTTVDNKTYQALLAQHRLIADVVCFPGCHINHLTPRTLDIDRVQALMPEVGIVPKLIIEGPPRRRVPILLRQTSFKALDEPVRFQDGPGTHTARFGEIEQRGIALTAKGRDLYDRLLAKSETGVDNLSHQQHLAATFQTFPDDLTVLREQQLAWFTYRLTEKGHTHPDKTTQSVTCLLQNGLIEATPMIYEDFLPVSAAGIFHSNLGSATHPCSQEKSSQAAFEQALGAKVQNEITLYAERQAASLASCGVVDQ